PRSPCRRVARRFDRARLRSLRPPVLCASPLRDQVATALARRDRDLAPRRALRRHPLARRAFGTPYALRAPLARPPPRPVRRRPHPRRRLPSPARARPRPRPRSRPRGGARLRVDMTPNDRNTDLRQEPDRLPQRKILGTAVIALAVMMGCVGVAWGLLY